MVVFDSSAVIALLKGEPGANLVQSLLQEAVISAVNMQEVAKRMIEAGASQNEARETISKLKLEILAHEAEDAYMAASLISHTKKFGRGLGDRSCMALAIRLGVPALTTDREWTGIEAPGLEVRLIR